jgi:hypothetical protein
MKDPFGILNPEQRDAVEYGGPNFKEAGPLLLQPRCFYLSQVSPSSSIILRIMARSVMRERRFFTNATRSFAFATTHRPQYRLRTTVAA